MCMQKKMYLHLLPNEFTNPSAHPPPPPPLPSKYYLWLNLVTKAIFHFQPPPPPPPNFFEGNQRCILFVGITACFSSISYIMLTLMLKEASVCRCSGKNYSKIFERSRGKQIFSETFTPLTNLKVLHTKLLQRTVLSKDICRTL